MLNIQWNMEEALKVREEEGREESVIRVVTNMLKKHYAYEDISDIAETSVDDIIKIAKDAGLAY